LRDELGNYVAVTKSFTVTIHSVVADCVGFMNYPDEERDGEAAVLAEVPRE